MDTLAEAPLEGHALQPLILFVLDRAWAPGDGGLLWDRLKQVVTAAVARALEETLADASAWEG